MRTETKQKKPSNTFLQLNDEQILTHAGKISADLAKELAHSEFTKFEATQRIEEKARSDKELEKIITKALARTERTPEEA